MQDTLIIVEQPGLDPAAVLEGVRAFFPEAVVEPREQFDDQAERLRQLGAAPAVIRSGERLAARAGPCYAWTIPQPGPLAAARCFVRRDMFGCTAARGFDAAVRLRVLLFARRLGTPEMIG